MTVKKSSFAAFAARTHPRVDAKQKKSSSNPYEILSDEYLARLRHELDEERSGAIDFGRIDSSVWSLGSWEMMEPPRPTSGDIRARLIPDSVHMYAPNTSSEPDEEEDSEEEEQEEEETEYEDDEGE